MVFFVRSSSWVTEELKSTHAHQPGGSRAACDTSNLHICHMTSVWDVEDFPQIPHVEGIYSV